MNLVQEEIGSASLSRKDEDMREGLDQPIVLPPGEGTVLSVLGEKITCKVASEDSGGRYSIIEEVSPPGGGLPPHIHHETDEIFYFLGYLVYWQTLLSKDGIAIVTKRHYFSTCSISVGTLVACLLPKEEVHSESTTQEIIKITAKYPVNFFKTSAVDVPKRESEVSPPPKEAPRPIDFDSWIIITKVNKTHKNKNKNMKK